MKNKLLLMALCTVARIPQIQAADPEMALWESYMASLAKNEELEAKIKQLEIEKQILSSLLHAKDALLQTQNAILTRMPMRTTTPTTESCWKGYAKEDRSTEKRDFIPIIPVSPYADSDHEWPTATAATSKPAVPVFGFIRRGQHPRKPVRQAARRTTPIRWSDDF